DHRFHDTAQMSAMLNEVERRGRWPRISAWRARVLWAPARIPGRVWLAAGIFAAVAAAALLLRGLPDTHDVADQDAALATSAEHHDPIPAMLQPLPEA